MAAERDVPAGPGGEPPRPQTIAALPRRPAGIGDRPTIALWDESVLPARFRLGGIAELGSALLSLPGGHVAQLRRHACGHLSVIARPLASLAPDDVPSINRAYLIEQERVEVANAWRTLCPSCLQAAQAVGMHRAQPPRPPTPTPPGAKTPNVR